MLISRILFFMNQVAKIFLKIIRHNVPIQHHRDNKTFYMETSNSNLVECLVWSEIIPKFFVQHHPLIRNTVIRMLVKNELNYSHRECFVFYGISIIKKNCSCFYRSIFFVLIN